MYAADTVVFEGAFSAAVSVSSPVLSEAFAADVVVAVFFVAADDAEVSVAVTVTASFDEAAVVELLTVVVAAVEVTCATGVCISGASGLRRLSMVMLPMVRAMAAAEHRPM